MEKKTKSLKEQMLEARKKSMSLFSDIAHRIETVATINGVEWINDSKATDLDSTYYSLELIEKPVIWIVQSNELEKDYSIFEKLVRYKVKNIVCFGSYETQIKYSFASIVDGYAHKETLAEAVLLAKSWAKSNDAVLFSPACSGYDVYESYRERGEEYRMLVNNLK